MKSYEERAREILESRDRILKEKRIKRKKIEKCLAGTFSLCAVLLIAVNVYHHPDLMKPFPDTQLIEDTTNDTMNPTENTSDNNNQSDTDSTVNTVPVQTTGNSSIMTIPVQSSDNPPATTNPVQPPDIPPATTKPVQPPDIPPATTKPVQPPDIPPVTTNPVQPPDIPPATTNPVQPPDIPPVTTNPVQPPDIPPTTTEQIQPPDIPPTTTKPVQVLETPSIHNTYKFKSYNELFVWLRSAEIESDEFLGKQYITFKEEMEKGETPLMIPTFNGTPAEIKGTTEWQNITIFTNELYNLPWIWYYCNYNGRCIVVGISYLDYLSEIGITVPNDINSFMQGIGCNSPNPENKYEYLDIYNDIYYDTLPTANGEVNAAVYDFNSGRTYYRFITNGCLLSVWDYNGEIIDNTFWSEFSLEEITF